MSDTPQPTCTSHAALVAQVNTIGQQQEAMAEEIGEIHDNTVAIIRELKGSIGNGNSLGITASVHDNNRRLSEIEAAHKEQSENSTLRRWDLAKIVIAQALTVIITLALAYWGFKK
jgi:hypothetical protein